ncbi:MAG: beta-lactamase family protein [Nitrosomonas sp.]|nr:beta-lactamase family protein [Nitrosomonas sp.]MCG7756434.1 beta-lactamase family protein [Nitrosomonas sp.]UJP01230.1 MAG: beta-lactamase family protein [Nitrosomonas sp.]
MTIVDLARSSSGFSFPADSEIRRILAERIETHKQSVGIVIGIVGIEGRRIIAHGHFGTNDPRLVDANTIFEIGSVTKVFTALLLAGMVQRAELALTDPIAQYLPKEIIVPQRSGKVITLVDLATHMSGLPYMPDNFAPANPDNPYADYSIEQLYDFLSGYQLTRDIGSEREYSNLGYGLLGHVLARRAGTDYETLVRERILMPFGMESTSITLSSEMSTRLATGHNSALEAYPNWDLPALAGAGALRSTANDLLTFLEMALGIRETPLASAFAAMIVSRRPTGIGDNEMGLGWGIMKSGDNELIWHNGATGGYCSFIGFLPKMNVGVVALSNACTDIGVDDIAQHLFNPEMPLAFPSTWISQVCSGK